MNRKLVEKNSSIGLLFVMIFSLCNIFAFFVASPAINAHVDNKPFTFNDVNLVLFIIAVSFIVLSIIAYIIFIIKSWDNKPIWTTYIMTGMLGAILLAQIICFIVALF